MRTLIDLPNNQIESLAEICEKEQISRSEAIRRAIARYLDEECRLKNDTDVFGIWKSRKIDSLKYEEKLRAEWDSEK